MVSAAVSEGLIKLFSLLTMKCYNFDIKVVFFLRKYS